MTTTEMHFASTRLYDIGVSLYNELAKKDSVITNDEKQVVSGDFEAEPFEVALKMSVFAENGLVAFFSLLPYEVPASKAAEFAQLICTTNYKDMYAGNFDYLPESGKIVFRLTLPFRNSLLSEELLRESINYCRDTVTKYNSMLFEASRE